MTHKEIKKLEESFDRYKKALALVYADGDVTSIERNRLISLKNELGLSDSDCILMEARFHETADQDGIKREELKDRHHCHLCDSDGKIRWNGIDHSMLEFIELGDTYIEASNGGSYTGLREPFVLSIGQSFEELLNEYGENHIYDAIEEGKLQVFDEQNDLETYLKLRFDIRDEDQLRMDYQQEKSNNRDWEQKYSFLSSDKLHSFISDEAFTKDMAQMIIVDFEVNGSPLVIDELGNVCEKSIWESKEEDAIVEYMPSGITTREIEILEDFLTSHPNIPAKQRVEVLKLKDTLEEINERLIEKEERTEEKQKYENNVNDIAGTLGLTENRSTAIEKKLSFTNDVDKMRDFDSLSKDEFLASYSYLTEEEYDATLRELKKNNLTGMKMVEILQAREKTFSETETQLPANIKEPVEIIKEIATQKELAEVQELFTREFKNRIKTRLPGPEKDPFIVAKAIINDWKTSKPDYIPALNKWLSDSLKKEGFSTKENLEKGFEKFFKKLSSPEQKHLQHKESDIGQGR